MQQPDIIDIPPVTLVGMHMPCSLAQDNTPILWKRFMPRRNEIPAVSNTHLYSVNMYGEAIAQHTFNPQTIFEKWAARAVTRVDTLPEEMYALHLSGGLYARFVHYGTHATFSKTLNGIFTQWLPASPFQLDHRPHFEVMTEKYLGLHHEDSEEEIWIPIKVK